MRLPVQYYKSVYHPAYGRFRNASGAANHSRRAAEAVFAGARPRVPGLVASAEVAMLPGGFSGYAWSVGMDLGRIGRGMYVVGAVLVGAEAYGDVVYMNNGDRITGDIKRVWDNELFVETPYADEFPISLDAVARIESDDPFEIELRDHSEITGRFGVDESGAMVLITETGTRPFSPMGIEELSEPEERFDWDARSDFSYRATRGNTETSNFLWQAAIIVTAAISASIASTRTGSRRKSSTGPTTSTAGSSPTTGFSPPESAMSAIPYATSPTVTRPVRVWATSSSTMPTGCSR